MYKRNKVLIWTGLFLLVVNVVIVLFWLFTNMLHGYVKVSTGLSNSIMTVDAVFAGFAYTTLGTMVSFATSADIKQVDSDGYLDKYYNGIYVTIFLFIVAIGIGCLTGFSVLGKRHHWLFLVQFILNLDAFVYFVLSVIGFRRLINWVRSKLTNE